MAKWKISKTNDEYKSIFIKNVSIFYFNITVISEDAFKQVK